MAKGLDTVKQSGFGGGGDGEVVWGCYERITLWIGFGIWLDEEGNGILIF